MLGYLIQFFLLKEFWGSGYVTEALKLLIEFAFTNIDLHKVIAECDAKKAMIRSGLSKEGEFNKHFFHRKNGVIV